MATLYAYKNFNNYYNRKLKKYDNLNDYPEPDYFETGTYLNFNPNDGINTTINLGRPGFNDYLGDCDYFIYSDDNINITSRWYIIEQARKMVGQYTITAHRDVLADNWDKVLSSECFVEKAILPDSNNLIFNKEDMSVNQIKKSETLLKDETGVAWIIGYVASNYAGENDIEIQANIRADYPKTGHGPYNSKSAFESDFGANQNVKYKQSASINTFRFYGTLANTVAGNGVALTMYQDFCINYSVTNSEWSLEYLDYYGLRSPTYPWRMYSAANNMTSVEEIFNVFKAHFDTDEFANNVTALTTDAATYNDTKYSLVTSNSDKVVDIASGSDTGYYSISTATGADVFNYSESSGSLMTYIQGFISTLPSYISRINVTGTLDKVYLDRDTYYASYLLERVASGSYYIDFPSNTARCHLQDAPYDMFCIPYGDVEIRNTPNSWTPFSVDKSLTLSIAQGLARVLGSNLIDLQIVPYCPVSGITSGEGYIDINGGTSQVNWTRITSDPEETTNACVLLWATAANGSKNIPFTINVDNVKVSNQCDRYRLVSPNYNGQFEFNAAMNNGVTIFNVDYSYIPYQPYIHINPVFSRMYGDNYNDARGLVCGGDFSVSYESDAWREFQIRNKNYQNIFDRGIQNMEVSHDWEMKQAYVGGAAGILSGLVGGATAGAAGGLPGMIAGGIVGGVASGVGMGLDIKMKESLYSEAVDYKKDMFGYQLDNIQALPYSLAKVSSINKNNKIFPFIEYYTCSDEEKTAFANKIAWNGMTVGTIGYIQDYILNEWSYNNIVDKGYIKARLIRFEDSNEDFHNVNAIADELFKGVYTK